MHLAHALQKIRKVGCVVKRTGSDWQTVQGGGMDHDTLKNEKENGAINRTLQLHNVIRNQAHHQSRPTKP